jgi:hypothetical protein
LDETPYLGRLGSQLLMGIELKPTVQALQPLFYPSIGLVMTLGTLPIPHNEEVYKKEDRTQATRDERKFKESYRHESRPVPSMVVERQSDYFGYKHAHHGNGYAVSKIETVESLHPVWRQVLFPVGSSNCRPSASFPVAGYQPNGYPSYLHIIHQPRRLELFKGNCL